MLEATSPVSLTSPKRFEACPSVPPPLEAKTGPSLSARAPRRGRQRPLTGFHDAALPFACTHLVGCEAVLIVRNGAFVVAPRVLLWPLCHACGQHACACHNRHHCKTNSHCWSLDRTNCRASFHFFGEIAKCLPARDGRGCTRRQGAHKPGITTSTAARCGLDVLLDFFQIERAGVWLDNAAICPLWVMAEIRACQSDRSVQNERSSTNRIANGRPARAPPSPSVNCSGVHRLSAAVAAFQ